MSFYPVQPLPDTNARQMAITQRPPSTSLLAIDSEDRFKNYVVADEALSGNPTVFNVSPYDFAISKAESLMNGFFTRVGVTEVNFPWAIPNINAKTQSITIAYTGLVADGVTEIVLAAGFYTPTNLAAAMQAAIRAKAAPNLAGFTMTYGNDNTPRFFYATNTVETIAFEGQTPNSLQYPYPNTQKQLFNVLGLTNINATEATSGSSAYTFCQATRYIDIVCTQLTNNQALKDQMSQIIARDSLCRVYLGDGAMPGNIPCSEPEFVPPGCAPFTIYRNFATPKQIQWLPNQPIPGYLKFEVYDDSGAPLAESIANIIIPLNGGTSLNLYNQGVFLDWSMTMLVSEN
jgi:hypothetical protein